MIATSTDPNITEFALQDDVPVPLDNYEEIATELWANARLWSTGDAPNRMEPEKHIRRLARLVQAKCRHEAAELVQAIGQKERDKLVRRNESYKKDIAALKKANSLLSRRDHVPAGLVDVFRDQLRDCAGFQDLQALVKKQAKADKAEASEQS